MTKILMLLRDWPDEDEMDIILIQWFRAFRAVLSSGKSTFSFILFCPSVFFLSVCIRIISLARPEYSGYLSIHDAQVTSADIAHELTWWIRAMSNGKRNKPAGTIPPRHRHNADGSIAVEEEGFYVALFNTYPDVFFAARSVAMHLISRLTELKSDLRAAEEQQRAEEEARAAARAAPLRRQETDGRRPAAAAQPLKAPAASSSLLSPPVPAAATAVGVNTGPMRSAVAANLDALESLLMSSLDLCYLVTVPLDDLFCSSRRMGLGDYRFIECAEKSITECLKIMCCVFVAATSIHAFGSAGEPVGDQPISKGTLTACILHSYPQRHILYTCVCMKPSH